MAMVTESCKGEMDSLDSSAVRRIACDTGWMAACYYRLMHMIEAGDGFGALLRRRRRGGSPKPPQSLPWGFSYRLGPRCRAEPPRCSRPLLGDLLFPAWLALNTVRISLLISSP